ncbi:MAG: GNAT family N-acetyltransferase [Actinobacteria bacterium]|nr:GNAT family N-acetyltransferase [Actinomycetota bacterium]
MQIFSRPASSQDLEDLVILECEARNSLNEFRGADRLASDVPEIGSRWLEELNNDAVFVLVGGIDSVVMGYLVARMFAKSVNQIATIEQVFVTHDARNLGVGDALVSSALAWAQQQKLTALDALALPGDRETKNLYERSGLVARLITVTKKLN